MKISNAITQEIHMHNKNHHTLTDNGEKKKNIESEDKSCFIF